VPDIQCLPPPGYDRAAAQLERNWVGKGNNPENLPFAANVKKGALVNLAQDGLYFDHLQAAVKDVSAAWLFVSWAWLTCSLSQTRPRSCDATDLDQTTALNSQSPMNHENGGE